MSSCLPATIDEGRLVWRSCTVPAVDMCDGVWPCRRWDYKITDMQGIAMYIISLSFPLPSPSLPPHASPTMQRDGGSDTFYTNTLYKSAVKA